MDSTSSNTAQSEGNSYFIIDDDEGIIVENGYTKTTNTHIGNGDTRYEKTVQSFKSISRQRTLSEDERKLLGEDTNSVLDQDEETYGETLSCAGRYFTWRYLLAVLLHMSCICFVFIRNSMPMAMVCMAAPVALLAKSEDSASPTSPGFLNATDSFEDETVYGDYSNITSALASYEFIWNAETQGLILTSIIILGFASPLFASWLQTMVNNKHLLSSFIMLAGLLTMLNPLAARTGPYYLVGLRIFTGIFAGANAPVIGDTVAWWGPTAEKLTMISICSTGLNVGSILLPAISGYMCSIPIDNGWPFIFYFFGGMACLWGIIWLFLGTGRPEEHPFISDKEKEYIFNHRADMGSKKKKEKPPMRKILTSVPVLAFLLTGCCHRWNNIVIMTSMPMFLKDVLRFSVAETGVLVSVFSLFRMGGTILWVAICNMLDTYIGVKRARKLCIVSGLTFGGLVLILSSFLGSPSSRWYFLFLFVPAMLFQTSGQTTLSAVTLDMAPRYAGFIASLLISSAALVSFSGPLLISLMTHTGSQSEWQWAWILMGCVYMIGGQVFLFFGDAELQPWAISDNAIDRDEKPENVSLTAGENKPFYGGSGAGSSDDPPKAANGGAANSASADYYEGKDETKTLIGGEAHQENDKQVK